MRFSSIIALDFSENVQIPIEEKPIEILSNYNADDKNLNSSYIFSSANILSSEKYNENVAPENSQYNQAQLNSEKEDLYSLKLG